MTGKAEISELFFFFEKHPYFSVTFEKADAKVCSCLTDEITLTIRDRRSGNMIRRSVTQDDLDRETWLHRTLFDMAYELHGCGQDRI